jgi:hypothetical protein
MAPKRYERSPAPPAPWSAELAKLAAEARGDGGTKLMLLLFDAGFTSNPAVKYIIRRERVAA